MELKPIGRVHNEIRPPAKMANFGVASTVEIFPEYEDALWRIEKHSHLWILAWIDRGERDVLQVTPRGGDTLHGVFAVRSPARPNPVGLTSAKFLKREGLMLYLDKLDFMDGTAVIDVKPYFAVRDLHFSASNLLG